MQDTMVNLRKYCTDLIELIELQIFFLLLIKMDFKLQVACCICYISCLVFVVFVVFIIFVVFVVGYTI